MPRAVLLALAAAHALARPVTISNVVPRRDTDGAILDAHDSKVVFKDGLFHVSVKRAARRARGARLVAARRAHAPLLHSGTPPRTATAPSPPARAGARRRASARAASRRTTT